MKTPKFREKVLNSETKLLLGRNESNNDELMKMFKGKPNTIIHTVAPGSPFGVIEENLKPSNAELSLSGATVAKYSQDWRDNKSDVKVNIFTGKDISKWPWMKKGTWKVKKSKTIKIKKADILKVK